jgi:hypothetical protein
MDRFFSSVGIVVLLVSWQLLSLPATHADQNLDYLKVLETDKSRLATNDHGPTLYKVTLSLRDQAIIVQGKDYNYEWLTIIPVQAVVRITYEESKSFPKLLLGSPLLAGMAVLLKAKNTKHWISLEYGTEEDPNTIVFLVPQERNVETQLALESLTGISIVKPDPVGSAADQLASFLSSVAGKSRYLSFQTIRVFFGAQGIDATQYDLGGIVSYKAKVGARFIESGDPDDFVYRVNDLLGGRGSQAGCHILNRGLRVTIDKAAIEDSYLTVSLKPIRGYSHAIRVELSDAHDIGEVRDRFSKALTREYVVVAEMADGSRDDPEDRAKYPIVRSKNLIDLMSVADFRKCGLSKLTEEELQNLNAWMQANETTVE